MVLADRIILSWGWRRRMIAFAAGAVGALAMAPLDIFPAMFVPMTVAVWLIDGSSRPAKGAGRRDGARLWSALDAAQAGFETCVISDLCRAIDQNGSLNTAMQRMTAAGVHFTDSDTFG